MEHQGTEVLCYRIVDALCKSLERLFQPPTSVQSTAILYRPNIPTIIYSVWGHIPTAERKLELQGAPMYLDAGPIVKAGKKCRTTCAP